MITACKVDEKITLEQFTDDTSTMSNNSAESFDPKLNSSINQCQRYCGNKDECWGCIKHCRKSYKWIAISECKTDGVVSKFPDGNILQKPGK